MLLNGQRANDAFGTMLPPKHLTSEGVGTHLVRNQDVKCLRKPTSRPLIDVALGEP